MALSQIQYDISRYTAESSDIVGNKISRNMVIAFIILRQIREQK